MLNIVCFHNPEEINGYLSNWYMSDFEVNNIKFSSIEQYMMYYKAVTFNDNVTAKEILNNTNAGKIKDLGRQVKNYNDTIWNGVRQIIVYEGLFAKFSQNNELKEKLLKTGNDILAECAVQDCIWATGVSMKDENRFDIQKWRGQNLLGFAIMQVREKLK